VAYVKLLKVLLKMQVVAIFGVWKIRNSHTYLFLSNRSSRPDSNFIFLAIRISYAYRKLSKRGEIRHCRSNEFETKPETPVVIDTWARIWTNACDIRQWKVL